MFGWIRKDTSGRSGFFCVKLCLNQPPAMKRKLLIVLLCVFISASQSFAQEKSNVKFGKITPEDFKHTVYGIDSNATAVVIADIGNTEMTDNGKGGFALEFKNYRRAHILNKNGYDIGNVTIRLYTDGRNEEDLSNLKAVTYNLENGKVVETKLESKSVFKDVLDKNHFVRKFTFPNIKEGSIIEYEYKVKSDFKFQLQPWSFQGGYPRLWSEYNVTIPEFYYYVTLSQGYQPYYIKDQKNRTSSFTVSDNTGSGASERTNFTAAVTDYRWVMKEVPALKEESFTSTIQNHIARIEFQLAEYRYPLTPQNIMGTWPQTCEELLKDESFGYSLNRDNPWLNDVMSAATGGATGNLQKARNIYKYIRDNMTCTNYDATFLRQPLKNILKNRSGNVAEINLLLVAMLDKAGLQAEPILLSTRSNGYTYAMYPLLGRFNYVIAEVTIEGQTYYLDASEPHMGFGKLDYECYNGHARVINASATPIELVADSLLERKVTSVFIINDDKGNFSGSVQQTPGYFESSRMRDRIKEKGKDQIFTDIKKEFNAEAELSNTSIDSLDKYEEPLNIKYDFSIKPDKEDIIYFNPMFGEAYKENPFKSAQRFYPVEMPYTEDETYLVQLQVPEGYVVDELPEQIVVKLNENDDGMFEYRISESNGTISLRSRLRIRRSIFLPDEYEMLREFYNLIVKKHSEQIVFKKKK
jgi:acyl carrier protein/transglutaminase-like putative cysteine protease